LKRAIELDADNGTAYFYRGESLNHLQRVDEAIEMLAHAVRLQPGNGRAYYTMGLLYDRKNLREEAQQMFRKAREVAAT
jgi:tetratricopeptide (TPR) repeat protein